MISSSDMVPGNRPLDAGTFVGSPGGAWPGYKNNKKWRKLLKLIRKRKPTQDYGGVGNYITPKTEIL